MISTRIDSKQFGKDMQNIIDYSLGYLDGVKKGKTKLLENLGNKTVEILKEFIDSYARTSPDMLHHVYEWNQVGSPNARLFDITYTVSNLGLSFRSEFRQSTSVKEGSRVPFYDKARIMEQGIPVTIRPTRAKALAFTDNGEEVFTKSPVRIENPGGGEVQGGFERAMDVFFNNYFRQSFLRTSGILDYIENPVLYKKNLRAGKNFGKSKGVDTGYRWIVNAGVDI